MQSLEKLVKGYKTYLQNSYQKHESRYRALAESGQSPKIMMIGCCDSRVSPDLIFNTGPGDLFVVRNVANIVPPYEPDGGYHGTSAAIEFAVTALGVQHIVIMGHSLCGGIRAGCEQARGKKIDGVFIPQWTSILNDCAQGVIHANPELPIETLCQHVEQEGVKFSLSNLRAFPFIRDRLAAGTLHIHGAYFDVKNAQLHAYDLETDAFIAVE